MKTPPPQPWRLYSTDFLVVKDASEARGREQEAARKFRAVLIDDEGASRATARAEDSLDAFVIERVVASDARRPRTPRQSAAIAAFSVALGRIAADVLAESGR